LPRFEPILSFHACFYRSIFLLSYNNSVNPTTLSRLLELNRQFYQAFALPFSATRQRLQPGVLRIVDQLSPEDNLLDLGCGNGELARELARCGQSGSYTGLDFSPPLLELARADQPPHFHFVQADLSKTDWDDPLAGSQYDVILSFAVLHHLPSKELHLQVLRKVRSLLSIGGRFFHSQWQFLNSPRLAARVQSWEMIGLSATDVDPGDYLLDWRQGGEGLRYVHHFSESELAGLAAEAGFMVVESFLSDGENHRLGLYQVWKSAE
jgi:tRNA (uracil-5-)-methyltransferase TRM9